jgi:HAD superfamily hydrolase (TIGR01509 family)
MGKRFLLYIFDMGGVVSSNNDFVSPIASHFDVSVQELYRLAGEEWMRMMVGNLSVESFWKQLEEKTGHLVENDLFFTYFHPTLDSEVVQLVTKLKMNARVVVGTNTIASHYEVHKRQGDYNVFHAVYASHLMGVAKPEPEFYLKVLEAEKRKPFQTVFIDDTEENVDASRAIGIQSILFTDSGNLERELQPFMD